MKRSVLLIGNYPPPYGGVPRHLEYLAPYLAARGWDVQVLSGQTSGKVVRGGVHVYKHTFLQLALAILRHLFKLRALFAVRYLRVLCKSPRRWVYYAIYLALGHDVIRAHGSKLISAYNVMNNGPVGELLSRYYDIPLVVTNFGEVYNRPDYFSRHADVTRAVCDRADALLAMSEHCARSYRLVGLSPEVQVIPYGVELERFGPALDGRSVRAKFGWGAEHFVVLFVGRLVPEMGVSTLLAAAPAIMRECALARLLIVGQRGELLESVMAVAQAHPGAIAVAPDVPFAELPSYYAAASVLTAPTRGDRTCGSLACIEAMATARPVVASNAGGIPEIVADGETGLVIAQDNPVALAAAVIELAVDPLKAAELGRAGRRRVESRFVEADADAKIAALFERLWIT